LELFNDKGLSTSEEWVHGRFPINYLSFGDYLDSHDTGPLAAEDIQMKKIAKITIWAQGPLSKETAQFLVDKIKGQVRHF
jgi:hypothetical protein